MGAASDQPERSTGLRQRVDEPIVLCVDLGTTGLKVGLLTPHGQVCWWGSTALHTDFGTPGTASAGAATQDAELWWQLVLDLAAQGLAAAGIDGRRIVGVAVVVDIRQREVSQEGESFLLSFLEALRLRASAKRALFFCVLAKFDQHRDEEETNELILGQFGKLFAARGMAEVWERRIPWMSGPSSGRTRFEEKVRGELRSEYEQQFTSLRNRLSSIWKEQKLLHFAEYY